MGYNMNMNSYSYVSRPLVLYGLVIWLAATLALRAAGEHVLPPAGWPGTLALFAVAFPAMAWVARRLCGRFEADRQRWPAAAISLALPTLLLDPFSSAFFPAVFPNIAPEAAGVFGGLMLWCCAGAFAGALWRRQQ
jgi:uncharacterized protein DUF5367